MKEVETLIPHRAPFLYVDRLTSATAAEIIGVKTFSDTDEFLSGSFPEFAFVPGMVLVEAMAQCGGAGIKKAGLGERMFGFAGIEKVLFHRGVPLNKEFVMVVTNIKISDKYFKQSGKGYVGDDLCVEATWMCVKIQ
ncbi:3-hydroxyacyl-ACP dehydratase FabZ family protein [Chryseolinea sp. T2]|uniref:3-hydroxyacyl-ACP dehydratase FabZ family protein n=1 Tax=Chryseolinea sp. T2 TaxID=3129255 RepID=UPI0030784A36